MIHIDDIVLYAEGRAERLCIFYFIISKMRTACRYRPDVFAVETNQFQELLRDELERSFRERGVPDAALFPVENRLNKNVRIRRLGVPYSFRSEAEFAVWI